jgi:uncharacterized protein
VQQSAETRAIYVDSSALVKLILAEPESDALEQHLANDDANVATSRLAVVEVSRAASIANPARDVGREVDRLLSSYTLLTVSVELLRIARRLASQSLRTLDAIHLASALAIGADELVAYDKRLLAAALEQQIAVATPGC